MARHPTSLLLIALSGLLLVSAAYAGRSLEKRVKAIVHATDTYTGKTNYSDALGLVAWCTLYPSLLEANEDPCLTPQWSWIECNDDAQPRVTAINLGGQLLYGELPDFSSMDALEKIDLHSNILTGSIPSFLGELPDLQELNLAYNYFSGLVPDSIACNKNLNLSLDGNSFIYTSSSCPTRNVASPPAKTTPTATPDFSSPVDTFDYTPTKKSSRKKKNKLPAILGGTFSITAFVSAVVGIFAIFRHKAKTAAAIAAAAASTLGPNDPKPNMPTEERPINTHATPTNMSPLNTN